MTKNLLVLIGNIPQILQLDAKETASDCGVFCVNKRQQVNRSLRDVFPKSLDKRALNTMQNEGKL